MAALMVAALTTNAQSKVLATITKPGSWLVNDTGHVVEVDSATSDNIVMEMARRGVRVWVVYIPKDSTLQVVETENGILFIQTITEAEVTEDKTKPVKDSGK